MAVQELTRGWIHQPETVKSVLKNAETHESAAVRQVAIRLRNDPRTVEWLKVPASRTEPNWVLRNAAIVHLQRDWKDDRGVLGFLGSIGRPPDELRFASPLTTLANLMVRD